MSGIEGTDELLQAFQAWNIYWAYTQGSSSDSQPCPPSAVAPAGGRHTQQCSSSLRQRKARAARATEDGGYVLLIPFGMRNSERVGAMNRRCCPNRQSHPISKEQRPQSFLFRTLSFCSARADRVWVFVSAAWCGGASFQQ